MMSNQLSNQLAIYCDGGSRGNPGPAACAFIVKNCRGQVVHQQGFYLGVSTNNQAEYQAVIEALKYLSSSHLDLSTINFYLDSLLVVNQLNGIFKIKDEKLKTKYFEVKKITSKLGQLVIRNFIYVPRSQNFAADKLVNQVLDKEFF